MVIALWAGAEQKGDLLKHVSVSPLHKASLLNAVRITQSRRQENIGQRGEGSCLWAYVTVEGRRVGGGGWACACCAYAAQAATDAPMLPLHFPLPSKT